MFLSDQALFDWIDESADIVAGIASDVDPETPIPACQGWTMAHLVSHLAPFYSGWFRYNLRHPVGDGDVMASVTSAPPLPDDHLDRVGYFLDACAGFTSLAREIDLDAPVWAFWTSQPARFWFKRAATELAVHTWDAQDAVGDPDPVRPDRAATTIDESLRGVWPGVIAIGHHLLPRDDRPVVPNTPAGFVTTDTGHRWRVDPTSDGLQVTTVDLPATVATGSAHDVMMHLYGRATGSALDVVGERGTVDAWRIPSVGSF